MVLVKDQFVRAVFVALTCYIMLMAVWAYGSERNYSLDHQQQAVVGH